jgi:hypothetical protein
MPETPAAVAGRQQANNSTIINLLIRLTSRAAGGRFNRLQYR